MGMMLIAILTISLTILVIMGTHAEERPLEPKGTVNMQY
jgi:hypothetical protein